MATTGDLKAIKCRPRAFRAPIIPGEEETAREGLEEAARPASGG